MELSITSASAVSSVYENPLRLRMRIAALGGAKNVSTPDLSR